MGVVCALLRLGWCMEEEERGPGTSTHWGPNPGQEAYKACDFVDPALEKKSFVCLKPCLRKGSDKLRPNSQDER